MINKIIINRECKDLLRSLLQSEYVHKAICEELIFQEFMTYYQKNN